MASEWGTLELYHGLSKDLVAQPNLLSAYGHYQARRGELYLVSHVQCFYLEHAACARVAKENMAFQRFKSPGHGVQQRWPHRGPQVPGRMRRSRNSSGAPLDSLQLFWYWCNTPAFVFIAGRDLLSARLLRAAAMSSDRGSQVVALSHGACSLDVGSGSASDTLTRVWFSQGQDFGLAL